jgi:hypothetical protein
VNQQVARPRLTKWDRIPDVLKRFACWSLAGASKAPLSVDETGKLYNTSVLKPSEWLTFEQAVYWASQYVDLVTTHTDKKGRTITQVGLDIGFILNESFGVCCIDLDVKDAITHPNEPKLWTTPEQFDFYWNIVLRYDTYTERSRSGKGLHLWLLGAIGPGFKRDGIEVYSQERFIICTGDVVLDRPVQERQATVSLMVAQMRPVKDDNTYALEEIEPDADDWSIMERAWNAANSEKFHALWRGDWVSQEYKSQSEADMSLMSMFAFYSRSNEQCRRLFRQSALGQRAKATKNNYYVDLTLGIIRTRQQREALADVDALFKTEALIKQLQAPEPPQAPPPEAVMASLAPVSSTLAAAELGATPWPPGLAGQLAKFIYQNAPRPVTEVGIVGALGLLAGIVGKAWHIEGSGLNMYIVLVGMSGIGTEQMIQGISAVAHECSRDNANFHKFINFDIPASGPALIKMFSQNRSSFVNVLGEFGKKLRAMSHEDGRNVAAQTLRTEMTNLYMKSAPGAMMGGITYSDKEQNVNGLMGVNYSMIGDTTPEVFFQVLTDSMMEDGFMSRMLVVECAVDRPAANQNRVKVPDASLVRALNNMATSADMLIMKNTSMLVQFMPDAQALMDEFNELCDKELKSTFISARRQMWNRAHLKALRIAAILAVADNWNAPWVNVEHAQWALTVVKNDIARMRKRLESGDVGVDDNARERKLVGILRDYLTKAPAPSYKIAENMRAAGIVPHSYLAMRVSSSSTFSNHKQGATTALKETLASMVRSGWLKLDKGELIKKYSFHGDAYQVLELPNYNDV